MQAGGKGWLAAAAWLCAGAAMVARASEVEFSKKPAVRAEGGSVRVEFAVSAPTDVAVAIVDPAGRVVRHLAAGVLGENAPAPLRKGSLFQDLVWDRKDDFGDAVAGPVRVRVSAGMTPRLDGGLLDAPNRLGGASGMAAGPKGELYVVAKWNDGGWGGATIRVFSRQGDYRRTIAPFPAGLPFERVKGLGAFETENGGYIPRVQHLRYYGFYPVGITGGTPGFQQPAVDGEGRLFLIGMAAAETKDGSEGAEICVLDRDGGVPEGWSFAGRDAFPKSTSISFSKPAKPCLAVSSDGRRLFVSGVLVKNKPAAAVYATDLRERGPVSVFVGDPAKPGSGPGELTAPCGVASDGKGHLVVADPECGRVSVFSETDGSFVTSWDVPGADQVAVSRRTGAVYVQTMEGKAEKGADAGMLLKFSNVTAHKPAGRQVLPLTGGRRRCLLALDDEADPPVIWAAISGYRQEHVLRFEDEGGRLSWPVDVAGHPADNMIEDVFVDRHRNEVYVYRLDEYWRFPDGSLELERVPITVSGNKGTQLQVGPSGDIYGHSWRGILQKWDRNGKPLTFGSTGKQALAMPSPMTYQMRGMYVHPRTEEIYLIQPPVERGPGSKPPHVLRVYDRDANFKREVVHRLSEGACGPRVDLAGNIYVGECARPESPALPAFFEERIGPVTEGRLKPDVFPYSWAYGSIVKFSADGGEILWPIKETEKGYTPWPLASKATAGPAFFGHLQSHPLARLESRGVVWARTGFSPAVTHMVFGCDCLAAYFDVDYFGRVFYPEGMRFRVGILDTNGNLITHVGRYGNRDASLAGPEVPLAFPIAVAATDRHLYVADILSGRLMRVRIDYARQEEVALD